MSLFKKITSIALSATLVVTSSAMAFASEKVDTVATFISDDGTYLAEKISHPQSGVKTNDGIVDYIGNGSLTDTPTETSKGDRAQSYSWSAIGYGDYMYIGTCANAMTQTLNFMGSVLGNSFDDKVMKAALNAMFNGHFFIEEEDGVDPKGVLLKLNTKTGEVKLIMSKELTGTNCNFRNAVEYKGNLYFCGSINGIPSVYRIDPKTDEFECVHQSLSLADFAQAHKAGISVGVRGMCVFNDMLVVSMVGLDGAYICATDTPTDKNSFKIVADMNDLFNYPAYRYYDSIYGGSVWDMVEYNNSLYVTLCTGTPDNKPDDNSMQSFAMVRANVDDEGNWSWTSVVGDEAYDSKYTYGINPNRTRSGAANLYVYDGYLYIGEYNDEQIALEDILFSKNCDFVNANLEQSVNLYRMNENEDVELVVGDADEMFPDGSLTGIGSGFGRNENQYIWRMQEFDGKLYIGTFDTSSLLEPIGQFTNGDLLRMSKEEWASQIDYLKTLIALLNNKNDSETVDAANDLIRDIENLEANLDSEASEDFTEEYQAVLEALNELSEQLPEDVLVACTSLINEKTLKSMTSFLKCAGYLAKAERGFDLYTLDKDLNVETITINGFGDPFNHGCRVFAVNDNGLSIGTANPFYGTQVWNLSAIENEDYLYYDLNRDGVENIIDATYLQKILANLEARPDDFDTYADLDGDGLVDIKDATRIRMYLAGFDV